MIKQYIIVICSIRHFWSLVMFCLFRTGSVFNGIALSDEVTLPRQLAEVLVKLCEYECVLRAPTVYPSFFMCKSYCCCACNFFLSISVWLFASPRYTRMQRTINTYTVQCAIVIWCDTEGFLRLS